MGVGKGGGEAFTKETKIFLFCVLMSKQKYYSHL